MTVFDLGRGVFDLGQYPCSILGIDPCSILGRGVFDLGHRTDLQWIISNWEDHKGLYLQRRRPRSTRLQRVDFSRLHGVNSRTRTDQ